MIIAYIEKGQNKREKGMNIAFFDERKTEQPTKKETYILHI